MQSMQCSAIYALIDLFFYLFLSNEMFIWLIRLPFRRFHGCIDFCFEFGREDEPSGRVIDVRGVTYFII
jgi:hypothetical protein